MKKLFLLLPVIAGIFWGTTGAFTRTLYAAGFNNTTVLFLRASIACIVYLIILLIRDRRLFRFRLRDSWLFAMYGILGVAGLNICYNVAISQLTLSLSAVLLSMAPIFTIILATIFLKENITILKIICMFIAIFGCVLVSGLLEDSVTNLSWYGIILGLLSAVMYGINSIVSKVAFSRGNNVFTLLFYGMLVVSIILIPFVDFKLICDFIADAPLENLILLFAHSACSSFLPYMLFNIALNKADAGTVSILASGTEPAAAMLIGFLLFAEQPSLLMIGGLILTIIAITLLVRPERNKR